MAKKPMPAFLKKKISGEAKANEKIEPAAKEKTEAKKKR